MLYQSKLLKVEPSGLLVVPIASLWMVLRHHEGLFALELLIVVLLHHFVDHFFLFGQFCFDEASDVARVVALSRRKAVDNVTGCHSRVFFRRFEQLFELLF